METLETFHTQPQEVPLVDCIVCGKETDSQAYSIVLKRAHITRKWFFCSLKHLREWAAPVR